MTKNEILLGLANGTIGVDAASQMLSDMEPKRGGAIYAKVSEKGGVSLYGLQRMPVTLYGEQWERLLAFGDDLKKFIAANRGRLSTKDSPKVHAPAVVISDDELLELPEAALDRLIASRSPGYTAETRKRWATLKDAQCAPAAGSMVTPDGAAVVVG